MPAVGAVSLTAIGTPANGRSSAASIPSAVASAPSGSRWTNELTSPSTLSMAFRDASVNSRALTSPALTSRASSVAGSKRSPASTGLRGRDRRRSRGAVHPLPRLLEPAEAFEHLRRQRPVVGTQLRRVVEDRDPALGRLRVAHAAADDRVEHLVAEALLQ